MADLCLEGKHAGLETAPVNERERCIADYHLDLYPMAELCARYHVSRKTGYKWIDRMAER